MAGRFKDVEWNLADERGNVSTWERAGVAVLMDIRDELKRLNAAIYCPNFMTIPSRLQAIEQNTRRRRTRRKAPR